MIDKSTINMPLTYSRTFGKPLDVHSCFDNFNDLDKYLLSGFGTKYAENDTIGDKLDDSGKKYANGTVDGNKYIGQIVSVKDSNNNCAEAFILDCDYNNDTFGWYYKLLFELSDKTSPKCDFQHYKKGKIVEVEKGETIGVGKEIDFSFLVTIDKNNTIIDTNSFKLYKDGVEQNLEYELKNSNNNIDEYYIKIEYNSIDDTKNYMQITEDIEFKFTFDYLVNDSLNNEIRNTIEEIFIFKVYIPYWYFTTESDNFLTVKDLFSNTENKRLNLKNGDSLMIRVPRGARSIIFAYPKELGKCKYIRYVELNDFSNETAFNEYTLNIPDLRSTVDETTGEPKIIVLETVDGYPDGDPLITNEEPYYIYQYYGVKEFDTDATFILKI